MKQRNGVAVVAVLALSVAGMWTRPASAQSEEARRVRNATTVFTEIMSAPDNGIPQEILERAEGVAVFPGLIKAGFVFGGERGHGILSVRDRATGTWSEPAFLTMTAGSWGAQIGGEQVDLVLVIMNRRGLDNLISDQFKIGGDASAAAGPVGRHVGASTDLTLHAEILSYSRSRGLFAGVTVNGAVVQPDRDANQDFYGQAFTTAQIVTPAEAPRAEGGRSPVGTSGRRPATGADRSAVTAWRQTLHRYFVAASR